MSWGKIVSWSEIKGGHYEIGSANEDPLLKCLTCGVKRRMTAWDPCCSRSCLKEFFQDRLPNDILEAVLENCQIKYDGEIQSAGIPPP